MAPASGSPLAVAGDYAGVRNVALVSIDFPVRYIRGTPHAGAGPPEPRASSEPGLLGPGRGCPLAGKSGSAGARLTASGQQGRLSAWGTGGNRQHAAAERAHE